MSGNRRYHSRHGFATSRITFRRRLMGICQMQESTLYLYIVWAWKVRDFSAHSQSLMRSTKRLWRPFRVFFSPKVNVVAERYCFRQCGQCKGETTDQYVAALKERITTCEFGTIEEEMIQDQLVEKTNSSRIRECLLLEVPLTLTTALTIAQRIETAVAEAKAMCTGAVDSTVHTVQSKGPQQDGKFKKGQRKPHSPTQATQGKTCYRCGSTQHTANFHGCPAKEASCNACKKKGHFVRVCKGSKHVSEVVVVPEVTILNVNTYNSGSIMCTVKVSMTGQIARTLS
ncbi:hypothetical protein LDENG_00111640 [Lucifuga dentata]|nr:hypothetical protein LDENG_00111640 [Lucifuga dentata]